VPEKELNPVKLSTGIMAESRTGSAESMRCKARDIHACEFVAPKDEVQAKALNIL
jgi:hypothetical protein